MQLNGLMSNSAAVYLGHVSIRQGCSLETLVLVSRCLKDMSK